MCAVSINKAPLYREKYNSGEEGFGVFASNEPKFMLHETFATDTISSRIREVCFISFMQVKSKVLLWGSPILCLLTVVQQLFYNADRKDRKKETAWNGQR